MSKIKVSTLFAGFVLICAVFFLLKISTANAKIPPPVNGATVTIKKDAAVYINGNKMTEESRYNFLRLEIGNGGDG